MVAHGTPAKPRYRREKGKALFRASISLTRTLSHPLMFYSLLVTSFLSIGFNTILTRRQHSVRVREPRLEERRGELDS